MANVTFSSPVMPRDITVYAVAGHRGTILAVAKAHKIPLGFNCQDGECGSCIVEVKHLAPSAIHGIALTEKEKELLRQLGRITREEITAAEVNDMPPRYRLACQCFIRDEDIIVSFEGDPAAPVKPAKLPPIGSIAEFYGYAMQVEQDAIDHYGELARAMDKAGHKDVADLFLQLADYSRIHLGEVKALAAKPSTTLPAHYVWPHHATPEGGELSSGDAGMARLGALRAALQGERRGYDFYSVIADNSEDKELAAKAKEFVLEEGDHVAILQRWIAREEAVQKGHDDQAHVLVIAFDLRPPMKGLRVLDRQLMQPEGRTHLGELVRVRLEKAQPHKAALAMQGRRLLQRDSVLRLPEALLVVSTINDHLGVSPCLSKRQTSAPSMTESGPPGKTD